MRGSSPAQVFHKRTSQSIIHSAVNFLIPMKLTECLAFRSLFLSVLQASTVLILFDVCVPFEYARNHIQWFLGKKNNNNNVDMMIEMNCFSVSMTDFRLLQHIGSFSGLFYFIVSGSQCTHTNMHLVGWRLTSSRGQKYGILPTIHQGLGRSLSAFLPDR